MKKIEIMNFLHIDNKTFSLLNLEPMVDGENEFYVTVVMLEGLSVKTDDGTHEYPCALGKVYIKNQPHWIEERPVPITRWLEE